MNRITQGQINVVVFTLNEEVTISSPKYLVRAKSRETKQIKRFILGTDTSGFPTRFNQFTITESSTELPLSAQMTFTAGFWDYVIYQQASATNLDEALASGEVERGIFQVISSSPVTKTQYSPGAVEYKSYRP